MAKSVLDSGWGMLKRFLQYKGEHAGRTVEIVSEMYTTQACSNCGCLSGPKGLRQLDVRQWDCVECGVTHDRDINSALNILRRAEVAGVRQRERVAAKSAVLPDTSSLQDMDRHELVAA
jgi:transposase